MLRLVYCLVFLILLSCDTVQPIGGPCKSLTYSIKVQITQIAPADTNEFASQQRAYCAAAFKVNYIVLSKDSLLNIVKHKDGYLFSKDTFTLKVDDGVFPGKYYLAKYNIAENSIFTAKYTEVVSGSCTPYSLAIDNISTTDTFEKDSCKLY